MPLSFWPNAFLKMPAPEISLRPLSVNDQELLWPFLALAAHEEDVAVVRNSYILARYAAHWGRLGDSGFVALQREQPVGAGWIRLWPGDDKGFGWVSDDVPELAMAVSPAWRGRGVGTQLLYALLAQACQQHHSVSLSVRDDNPALRLYQRVGFRSVPGTETINRVGGISFIMVCRFPTTPNP